MTEEYTSPKEDYLSFFKREGFEVSQMFDPEHADPNSVEIRGKSLDGSFSLVFQKGCTPPGKNPGEWRDFENTTLYLEEINVHKLEGQGLGTDLMRSLVDAARHNGFAAIRSHYVSPAMVVITQKLYEEGKIEKPIYEAHFSQDWAQEPTTDEMLASPNSYDTVEDALKVAGEDNESGALCVFKI